MTNEDIQKRADELGLDISGHILGLPIERQKKIAKRDGYGDDFERFVDDMFAKKIRTHEFLKNRPVHTFDSIEEAEAAGFVVPSWQKSGETLVATFHKTLD